MRGDERAQDGMFSYVSLEQRVPQDHPLRAIRKLTDEVLRSMSGESDALYSEMRRRSIVPEYVLRALLLQVLFSVRSERQLVEQINYNLLFRWFVGLGMDDDVEPRDVLEEPRPSAELGDGAAVLCGGEPAGEAIYVGRPLHRGRHVDSGMGIAEELSPEGRLR